MHPTWMLWSKLSFLILNKSQPPSWVSKIKDMETMIVLGISVWSGAGFFIYQTICKWKSGAYGRPWNKHIGESSGKTGGRESIRTKTRVGPVQKSRVGRGNNQRGYFGKLVFFTFFLSAHFSVKRYLFILWLMLNKSLNYGYRSVLKVICKFLKKPRISIADNRKKHLFP